MIKNYRLLLLLALIFCLVQGEMLNSDSIKEDSPFSNDVGYRVGKVQSYKKLKSSQKSALYEIVATQLDDNRPIKLIDLHGSHYQVGFDYGFMLSQQIQFTYKNLFQEEFNNNKTLITIFQAFFDWQYHNYLRKQLPIEFLDEIRGVKDGATKAKQNGHRIKQILQRTLVISSIPSTFHDDLPAVLWDQIAKSILHIKNQQIQNYLESNVLYVIREIRKYIKKMQIMCSFSGVWGKRTLNGQLYTARNLDWTADTGINMNKLITIFNIDNTISHATLGFPGMLGAVTGISAKGITTHEAGQASDLQTMQGFQWTLRMRQVMMKANNLNEAIKVWNSTKNTLGMNFMIGSGIDKKAVVFQQMRGYAAMFFDNDARQNRTVFEDDKGDLYVAGFSILDALYRTNHGYDQTIRVHSHTKFRNKDSGTVTRYFTQRDMFNEYQKNQVLITSVEAVNMAAVMGGKQHRNYYTCLNNQKGDNVISVVYQPVEMKMWASFEYGYKNNFRSACCGVYVQINLKDWLKTKSQSSELQQNTV